MTKNMVREVVLVVSEKGGDDGVRRPGVGFYRNQGATFVRTRTCVVGSEGCGSFETVVVSSRKLDQSSAQLRLTNPLCCPRGPLPSASI